MEARERDGTRAHCRAIATNAHLNTMLLKDDHVPIQQSPVIVPACDADARESGVAFAHGHFGASQHHRIKQLIQVAEDDRVWI